MQLSHRLNTLAGYYKQSSLVYDIGCDHGQLGLSFLKHEKVIGIYLIDPSVNVIKTLNNYIDSYITMKHFVNVLCSKGQDIILEKGSKTIYIAGMGGNEIKEILIKLMPQLNLEDRVIVSPHRNILELRSWLSSSLINLINETSIYEEGQFYQFMELALEMGGKKVHPYGKEIWQSDVGSAYIKQQIATFSAHQNAQGRAYVAFLKQLITRI